VMAHEGAAARVLHDDAAGLGDDGAAALARFAALAAEIIEAAWLLLRSALRQRRDLGGARRRWQRRGHSRRRPADAFAAECALTAIRRPAALLRRGRRRGRSTGRGRLAGLSCVGRRRPWRFTAGLATAEGAAIRLRR